MKTNNEKSILSILNLKSFVTTILSRKDQLMITGGNGDAKEEIIIIEEIIG